MPSQTVAQKILDAVRQNGRITNLFMLTIEMGLAYPYAHKMTHQLADSGEIELSYANKPGSPLVLSCPETPPTPLAPNPHGTPRTAKAAVR